ncbi:MAG: hypothetical protein ACK5D5_12815 [Bacteroidota bacterium]|jgi:hypothetical protein
MKIFILNYILFFLRACFIINPIVITFFLFGSLSFSQTVIWSEDFQSYTDGTQNSTKWTTTANNCDADGLPGIVGNNFWGVRTTSGDKEFCCEDIEGVTCCLNSQGQSDNMWISSVINISGYSNISISMSIRTEGTMECTSCGNGQDLLKAEYQINGGAWITFVSLCGPPNGFVLNACEEINTGSSLRIRVLLGNQADDEEWYFDDINVVSQTCAVLLPIELIEFKAKQINKSVELNWITASEKNNAFFTVERSKNGEDWYPVSFINSQGNSSVYQYYKTYDYSPFTGNSYYRLKQSDFDGSYSYSNVILLNMISDERKLIKKIDLLGREVNDDFTGISLFVYDNGEIEKVIRVKE